LWPDAKTEKDVEMTEPSPEEVFIEKIKSFSDDRIKPPLDSLVKGIDESGFNQYHKAIKYVEEDSDNDEEAENTVSAGSTMDISRIDRTMPYVINDVEFSEEFDHHDKVSLYYYSVDDILCDENEEIFENAERFIGEEALSLLGDGAIIWVRNEPLTIDYEILTINKSYAEAVHGIEIGDNLTPRERYTRNKRKELLENE
jgi:hypothetical protein